MSIFLKGKSKYITSPFDGKVYNITTGHLARHLININIPIEVFITDHLGVIRDMCQCCNKPAAFKGTEGLKWKWWTTCGDKLCAIELRRRGRKAVTKEQEAESVRKRNETFANNPELLKNRSKLAHEANLQIGEDGLTGYERTAKKRAETLTKKHGRSDYANWEKTKQTWSKKSDDEIQIHSNKIRNSWNSKSDAQKQKEIQQRKATNMHKYGMECPGNLHLFKGYSEQAASLFRKIDDGQAEYKPKCREFSINGKLFDFRRGSKLIEFNGDYWHANPKKYSEDYQVGRSRKRTAQQIWEADAKKIKLAEDSGYQVKVVWESEYKKDPQKVIRECTEWLNS